MLAKPMLGLVASLITITAYIPYIFDIFRNKTKPHLFSWFVWTTLTAIVFFGLLAGGAGAGAWFLGITVVVCSFITALSFKKGTKDVQLIDWVCMFGAFIAIALWLITKTPFLSVIMVTITDALAFFPTIRKSYSKPYQETIIFYFINIMKFIFGLLALEKYSLITALYPAYLIFANGFFVVFLYIRRRRVKYVKTKT